jgi:predicted small lipoprotein YifL
MKKLITIALALVLALSLAACGGNSGGSTTTPPANNNTTTPPSNDTPGNSQSTDTTPSNAGGDTTEWPENDVGNLVPKPDFNYNVKSYLEGEARIILTVEFPGASKEQIQSYNQTIVDEVRTAYPDTSLDEKWDSDSVWGNSFSFKNETGMSTMVSLKWYADSDSELIIEKVLK